MAQQLIQTGTLANDGTGDPLRTSFTKVNSNFTELYNAKNALATVANSGSYNDLVNKPSIPTSVSELVDGNGNLIVPTKTPSTSKGVEGDMAGAVAFDDSYIYRCAADYTDGVADIWKRVAWSNDTW
jgi:hypothetical protein